MFINALILGCPGAGKGTQTTRIITAKIFNSDIKVVSSGDLLRQEIAEGSALGLSVRDTIKHGHLVKDSQITPIILRQIKNQKHGWILDGFPRTLAQAHLLDDSHAKVNLVINLDVPHEVILDRIRERWIHVGSGRTYNLSYNPPKVTGRDDITGEPLSKRPDDDVDAFKVRLEEYEKLTVPLIEYYNKRGILMNFRGRTSDEITPLLIAALKGRSFHH